MATEINLGQAVVKERSPWAPVLLTLLTVGIYGLVWYYKINREMRDVGAARGDEELASTSPAVSLLAVTLGALLIVPSIVSTFKAIGRIRRSEALAGCPSVLEWGLVVALYIVGLFFWLPALYIPYLMQEHLNRAWRTAAYQPGVPAGQPATTARVA